MPTQKSLIPVERIERSILLIRGHKVMLDSDLAELYGVTTGRLNEAVKRNINRFPNDFMFQLTRKEFDNLKSQFAIANFQVGRPPDNHPMFSQNRAWPCSQALLTVNVLS